MRVINLDETGIKLIASNKKQMYLSLSEIKDFIDEKYKIEENLLVFYEKKLLLSESDIRELPNILNYMKATFNK